ncbi:MAG TPA: metallophosphoesterase family protein [Candidatus Eisenbacteria bacterium]|nr:metallophosphoesterase family protein [Candidatus Eisenbacteria bacterium]
MPELMEPIAVFGGPYGNHAALRAVLEDAARRGAATIYCLGDLGGFGPRPQAMVSLLEEFQVVTVAGNYDRALTERWPDCGCGYTHPRDNEYARIAYAFTDARTTDADRAWMARLPGSHRLTRGGRRYLLCHGSPRQTNEFLWESASSDGFLARLAREAEADQILCTHTGLHWQRQLPESGVRVVNVGAVGRPANDGRRAAWYAWFAADRHDPAFIPAAYDAERVAAEMDAEGLPPEFGETIRTGWWTTCLEILPAKERARGRW